MAPRGRPKKSTPVTVEKEKREPTEKNYLFIDNLPAVTEKVRELVIEKKMNPSVVQDGDPGVVHINGEPCMIVGNDYFPYKEARLVLQTRKVVAEYLKLQDLINNVIN